MASPTVARQKPRATATADAAAVSPSTTRKALRDAALALFVEVGFHGTSMRDIALRCGSSVSHLYYYYPSKARILHEMMVGIADDLLAVLGEALEQAGDGAASRLKAIVRAEVLFHCERQAEAFVGRSELRSLTAEHRPDVIQRYGRVTRLFRDTVDRGVRQGVFHCAHVPEATNALLAMCNGVSGWYQRDGRLTPSTLADRHAELALLMVGAQDTN